MMKRFRFAYLLASLLIVIFIRPFIAEQVFGVTIVNLLLFVTLVAGAFTAIERRHQFLIITALALASSGSRIAWQLHGDNSLIVIFLITTLIFYAYVTWFLLKSLFTYEQNTKITRDTLCQAISVYLMLGITWTFGYALLEHISPGSFSFDVGTGDEVEHFERFIGFSFITLTTLGYGNISPNTPRADSMATLQAVVGQIYLAIVVARLVAMQLTQKINN